MHEIDWPQASGLQPYNEWGEQSREEREEGLVLKRTPGMFLVQRQRTGAVEYWSLRTRLGNTLNKEQTAESLLVQKKDERPSVRWKSCEGFGQDTCALINIRKALSFPMRWLRSQVGW